MKALPLIALILALFLVQSTPLGAQNATTALTDEKPYSFTHKLKKKVRTVKLDGDKAYKKLMAEKNPFKDIRFYLGQYDTDAKMNMQQYGTWEELPNGDWVWRIKLSTDSPLVTGIGIHADKSIQIPEGAKLFFYSDDKKSVVGPVTAPNVKNAKQLLINTIPGKNIWIEYHEPKAQQGMGIFNIDAILFRFVEFPYSFAHPLNKEVPFINLISKEREDIATRDMKKIAIGEQAGLSTGGIRRNCFDMGIWEDLPNGDRIWRMGFESEIAFGIDFRLTLQIPEDAYVTFYSVDKMYVSSVFNKPLDDINNTLGTGSMPGNRYIMEYYEPHAHRNSTDTKLIIRWLEYDLTKWVAAASNTRGPEAEVACSPNTTCDCDDFNYDASTTNDAFCGTSLPIMDASTPTVLDPNFIPKLKRSVVRFQLFFPCTNQSDPNCTPSADDPNVMIYNPSTKYYASGALINNANNQTFVLSANHVLKKPSPWTSIVNSHQVGDDLHWVVDFNFETTCNNFLLPTTFVPEFFDEGAVARAGNSHSIVAGDPQTQSSTDFLLIELKKPIPPAFNPHYAGWDAATQTLPTVGLSISHPRGFDKRFAIQDDAVNLITGNVNNGIKAFSSGNSIIEDLVGITENNNGEQFAVTFDRGATLPASSGSPYFNQDGKIIGDLSGGYVQCDLNNPSHPNGNNNKVEKYGRFWYYYDSYPNGNMMGGSKIRVTDPSSPGGTAITPDERSRTLIDWLPDNDGIMDGLAVNDCEIYMKDCLADNGTEPSTCTTTLGTTLVASPDLWNNRININDPLDAINTTHEMPDFKDPQDNHLDNYICFRVKNQSSICTSAPATLHLYWAMASTGLQWPQSWQNYDIGIGSNTCIAGNEIGTNCYANEVQPYQIPPLAAGAEHTNSLCWLPPNFTDSTADPTYYPYQNPSFCANLQATTNYGSLHPRFALSLLARIASLDNPIRNEQHGSIMNNVRNSNNITLRNTVLADIAGPAQIVWIAGTGNSDVVIREVRSLIEGGNAAELQGLLNVELLPGTDLWDKWASTGFKGEGIEIVSDGVVKITNFEIAKLLDIPFDENEGEPLAIRVTIINSSGKVPNQTNIPDKYAFTISHETRNPTGNELESSPCLVEVDDIKNHLYADNISTFAALKAQPNPFDNETMILFDLYEDSQVSLEIYTLQGQRIKTIFQSQFFEQGSHSYRLAEPDFPAGLYVVLLNTERGKLTEKLVKYK